MRFVRFLLFSALFLAAGPELSAEEKPLSLIGFGSCSSQDKPMPIWESIVARKPELYLSLGDNIYGDSEDMAVLKAKYDKVRADKGYAKLRELCPHMAIWDDHDYGKNDAGAEYPKKKESQQLFCDFFDLPKDHPLRTQEGVYNSKIWGPEGKRVQVIMLDTRYFRSPLVKGKFDPVNRWTPYLPQTDPAATMLGEAQWKWLEEELKKPAEIRLLVSGIQVISDEHVFEKWATMPAERARLYNLIKSTKAEGLIVLSGDRHLAELSMIEGAIDYPLYDLTSSGLTQASQTWRAVEKNRNRVAGMPWGNNFGMVGVDWSLADPLITLQVRDEAGDISFQHKVPLSVLKIGSQKKKGNVAMKEEEPQVKPSEGAIGPEEAAKKVGESVVLEMKVMAVGTPKGRLLLNSKANFRDEANFTINVTQKALTGKLDKATADTFKGKVIRVKGKVSLYQGKAEISVDDEKMIEFVEKKD